jgi:hypothetical protein
MIVVSRGRPCHVPTVPLVTLYSSLDFPATIAMSYRARSQLRSNNPTGLLRTTPFRSLDLEGCGPFREQYLELSHKLASEGCNAALDAILV